MLMFSATFYCFVTRVTLRVITRVTLRVMPQGPVSVRTPTQTQRAAQSSADR